jgi:hypothetical protein
MKAQPYSPKAEAAQELGNAAITGYIIPAISLLGPCFADVRSE